jgi:hypothetical protein
MSARIENGSILQPLLAKPDQDNSPALKRWSGNKKDRFLMNP